MLFLVHKETQIMIINVFYLIFNWITYQHCHIIKQFVTVFKLNNSALLQYFIVEHLSCVRDISEDLTHLQIPIAYFLVILIDIL